MKINKQAFDLIDITPEEYLNWCADNNKLYNKRKTILEFFKKVKNNKIVRDNKLNKLVNKRKEV